MSCTAYSNAFQFCILFADPDVYLILAQMYHKADGDSSDFLFWMCAVWIPAGHRLFPTFPWFVPVPLALCLDRFICSLSSSVFVILLFGDAI